MTTILIIAEMVIYNICNISISVLQNLTELT